MRKWHFRIVKHKVTRCGQIFDTGENICECICIGRLNPAAETANNMRYEEVRAHG